MKDNFSSQSDLYAKYRPSYPQAFFDYLNSIVPNKQNAWDCGTGNGQVAFELAKTFECVFATDISQSQIDNAMQANNIFYSVQPAEKTNFPNQQFDLMVVAQAIHWFDFEKFYAEVKRTAKSDSVICAVGYGLMEISENIDPLINEFYENVLGYYWDKERRYIDEQYQTIPFPFEEISAPRFAIKRSWALEHLIGYLNTWSAVKHFVQRNKFNPIDDFRERLLHEMGEKNEQEVRFPLLLRIGKVNT